MINTPMSNIKSRTQFHKVRQFHAVYDAHIGADRQFPTANERALRARLLREEVIDECVPALKANDLVKIADGLGDILYIIHGTFVSYGLDGIYDITALALPVIDEKYAVNALEHAFDNYLIAEADDDFANVWLSLVALAVQVGHIAHVYGVPIVDVFNEIHESNMSKLGEDGRPVRRADGKILKGPHYFKPRIAAILDTYAQRARRSN